MRRVFLGALVLVCGLFGLVACGPQAKCNEVVRATCDYYFDCSTLQRGLYKDRKDCYVKLGDSRNCDLSEPCGSGKYWDVNKGNECLDAYRSEGCKANPLTLLSLCTGFCKSEN